MFKFLMKTLVCSSVLIFLPAYDVAIKAAPVEQLSTESAPAVTWSSQGKKFKSLTLDNKMQVVLISDPNAKQSAAGMNVRVGAFEDPKGQEGIAHLLEHLLFMGTEKYPEVGSFRDFLSANQGFSNASTSFERTYYYFSINTSSYSEALDRWSAFFKEPLFAAEFVEKEKNQVHSEYSNRRAKLSLREFRLFQLSQNEDHPANKFLVGSNKSLAGVTREDVISFYDKYYSANQMYLSLSGPQTLEELERLAEHYFAAVPNKNRPDLKYSSSVRKPGPPRLMKLKPEGDDKNLEITFYLDSENGKWRTKPANLAAILLASTHEGSLFDTLQEKGWVTDFGGGLWNEDFAAYLSLSFELTDAGLANWEEIVTRTYSYIEFLKQKNLEPWLFEEFKRTSQQAFEHRGHISPVAHVETFAINSYLFSPRHLEERTELFHELDRDKITEVLEKLRPENSTLYLVHPSANVDKYDPFYEMNYGETEVPETLIAQWKAVKAGDFSYRTPNSLIPAELPLKASDSDDLEVLEQDKNSTLYFAGDNRFNLPRVHSLFSIKTKTPRASAKNIVLSELFTEIFNHQTKVWATHIRGSNRKVSASLTSEGLAFAIIGLTGQGLAETVQKTTQKVSEFRISPTVFIGIKEGLVNAYKRKLQEDPYVLAGDGATIVAIEGMFSDAEKLKELESATASELNDFVANELFLSAGIESLVYGNVSKAEAKQWQILFSDLIESELPRDQWLETSLIVKAGERLAYVGSSESGNHGYYRNIYFGMAGENPQVDASLDVLGALWKASFFTKLRSEKNLGYIVHMDTRPFNDEILRARFIIQSAATPADELARHVEDWLVEAKQGLEDVPEEDFEAVKASILVQLKKDATTMEEQSDRFLKAMFIHDGDSSFREREIEALEKLTKKEFLDIVNSHLDNTNIRQATGYISAKDAPRPQPLEGEVERTGEDALN